MLQVSFYSFGQTPRWRRVSGRLVCVAVLAAQLLLTGCQFGPGRKPLSDTSVAIISSSKAKIFSDVVTSLKTKVGKRTRVYYLTGNTAKDQSVIRRVNASDRNQVVTIGLRASRLGKQLVDKQIVFCQVFNYRQFGLVAPFRKGVSAVPPPDQLFRRWKRLAPGLKSVLVITGPTHRQFIKDAQLVARRHGVRLKHFVVRSDKEFVYTFKQNAMKYQGLWLLPDNRVLSRKAIHSVLSFSVKNGKQVLVFVPQLLQIGGLISAVASADDVANQVIRRLQDGAGQQELPGPAVTHLTRVDFKINYVLARQFGLTKKRKGRSIVK